MKPLAKMSMRELLVFEAEVKRRKAIAREAERKRLLAEADRIARDAGFDLRSLFWEKPRHPRLTRKQSTAAARMGMSPSEYVAGITMGIKRGLIPPNALRAAKGA